MQYKKLAYSNYVIYSKKKQKFVHLDFIGRITFFSIKDLSELDVYSKREATEEIRRMNKRITYNLDLVALKQEKYDLHVVG